MVPTCPNVQIRVQGGNQREYYNDLKTAQFVTMADYEEKTAPGMLCSYILICCCFRPKTAQHARDNREQYVRVGEVLNRILPNRCAEGDSVSNIDHPEALLS